MTAKRNYPTSRRPAPPVKVVRNWALDEDVTLSRTWGKERTCLIAQKLDRSPDAIIARAKRLGLPNIDEETRQRFIREGYNEWKDAQ